MTVATIHLERTIDASHVIPDHPGKCGRLHGHTYRFEVWVTGPVGEDGMVIDFYEVKSRIDAWDHRHLNDEVDFVPTAELLAVEMHRRLLEALHARVPADQHHTTSVRLRLWETPNAYAEVGG